MNVYVLKNADGKLATSIHWNNCYTKLTATASDELPPVLVLNDTPEIRMEEIQVTLTVMEESNETK